MKEIKGLVNLAHITVWGGEWEGRRCQTGGAHPRCHRLPHHCHPCSQRLRRSASAVGCSVHSCTGTGPYHSGEYSLSVGMGVSSLVRPLGPCPNSEVSPFLETCVLTSSEPSAQSWSPSHFQRPAMQRPLAQENSLSEQGRGAGERQAPSTVGTGHLQPLDVLLPSPRLIPTPLEATADWRDDQLNQTQAVNWLFS